MMWPPYQARPMPVQPSIHDLLGLPDPGEDVTQPGGGLVDILGGPTSPPMAGTGGAPSAPAAPASPAKPDRFAMLEEEALKALHGEGPKRPDMKLKWNEILAAAINPDMLKVIFERKMAPYYQDIEDRKSRQQALQELMQLYRMRPEPEKPQRPMAVSPGQVVIDPQTGKPIFSAPPKPPTAPKERGPSGFSPGSEIIDPDEPTKVLHRVPFRPKEEGDRSEQYRQRFEADARRYYASIKASILSGLNSDRAHFGDTPEQKEALAEQIAARAYDAYLSKFGGSAGKPPTGAPGGGGSRPTAVERVKELDRQGLPKEQIRAILKAEGYEVQ